MRRRKHAVRLLDDAWHQYRLTVDICSNAAVESAGLAGHDHEGVIVPLGMLYKARGRSRNFDLCDESGTALSLLPATSNAHLTFLILATRAARANKLAGPHLLDDSARFLLFAIATEPPLNAIISLQGAFADGHDNEQARIALLDPEFRALCRAAADASFVFAEYSPGNEAVSGASGLDSPVRRKLLKLQFDTRHKRDQVYFDDAIDHRLSAAGLTPFEIEIQNPFAGAGSFHLEVSAPPGLEIIASRLEIRSRDAELQTEFPENERQSALQRLITAQASDIRDTVVSTGHRGSQTHCYVSEVPAVSKAAAVVRLRADSDRFSRPAFWASFAVTLTLIVTAFRIRSALDTLDASSTVLLIFPSLAALAVAQPGDHPATLRLVQISRRLLIVSGFCAFLAVVALTLIPSEVPAMFFGSHHEHVGFTRLLIAILAVISAGCTVILWLGRKYPRPAARDGDTVEVPGRFLRGLLGGLLFFVVRRPAKRAFRRIAATK